MSVARQDHVDTIDILKAAATEAIQRASPTPRRREAVVGYEILIALSPIERSLVTSTSFPLLIRKDMPPR